MDDKIKKKLEELKAERKGSGTQETKKSSKTEEKEGSEKSEQVEDEEDETEDEEPEESKESEEKTPESLEEEEDTVKDEKELSDEDREELIKILRDPGVFNAELIRVLERIESHLDELNGQLYNFMEGSSEEGKRE